MQAISTLKQVGCSLQRAGAVNSCQPVLDIAAWRGGGAARRACHGQTACQLWTWAQPGGPPSDEETAARAALQQLRHMHSKRACTRVHIRRHAAVARVGVHGTCTHARMHAHAPVARVGVRAQELGHAIKP